MQARDALMTHIKQRGIHAVCPYAPLHSFPIGKEFGYQESDLPITVELSRRLLSSTFALL
jgi:dTDP-4-amino-4,6-dideoxygalactose transaminase